MAKRRKKTQDDSKESEDIATLERLDAEDAPADGATTSTTRRAPPWLGAAAVAALLVVLAGAGFVAWKIVDARLAAIESGPDVAETIARLDALDAAVSTIEDAPAVAVDTSDIDDRLMAIEQRLAEVTADDGGTAMLTERIEALERSAGGDDATAGDVQAELGRLADLISDLERRLAAVESRTVVPSAAQPAMLLAVGQLRAALRGSGPYAAELDALVAVVGDDAGLTDYLTGLAARAGTGMPTVDALQARFTAVAVDAIRAARGPEEPSWIDRTAARLAQLVTVRRVGDVPGETVEAIVARAERRLAAGDLAAAVDEVGRLDGAAGEAAAAWLADARARLAAERALAALDARVVAAMGATRGDTAGGDTAGGDTTGGGG